MAVDCILRARSTAGFRAVSDLIRVCFRKISLALAGTIFAFDKQIVLCALVKASYFLIHIHALVFRKRLGYKIVLSRASHIICGARFKMKMSGPLFKMQFKSFFLSSAVSVVTCHGALYLLFSTK